MKLPRLLAQRLALLRQTRLANLAYAYSRLRDFADRIARARLGGAVLLQPVDPAAERFCTTLVALERSQAVLEEHFADEDIAELAEVLGFVTGQSTADITFALEELAPRFLQPVRDELLRAGVDLEHDVTPDTPAAPENLPQRPRPETGS